MSGDKKNEEETAAEVSCCASCGISGIDNIKLESCPSCDLVKYCSEECRDNHREKHESICKERAAVLRDEILFKQPESSYLGDCPICMLPMLVAREGSGVQVCCGKNVCEGCSGANFARQRKEHLELSCPFCRTCLPKTEKEAEMMLMKRAESNDPVALNVLAQRRKDKGDYSSAFEYCTRAINVDAGAHWMLSCMFMEGEGVTKDEEREIYHAEEAVIAGNPFARKLLAKKEWKRGKFDRAVRHLIIAANLGEDESLKCLKNCYKYGHVSKEDFAAALRAHQAAVNEMKSPQRKAEEARRRWAASDLS